MKKIKDLYLLFYYKLYGGVQHARKKGCRVGNNCRVYIHDLGSEPNLISIGDNVTITGGVKLLTHDGSACLITQNGKRLYNYGEINIGSNVFIGTNSIIMPNVSVVDNVIIGAGAIVTKSITESGVYVGAPAKYIKSFEEFQISVVKKSNLIDENMKII